MIVYRNTLFFLFAGLSLIAVLVVYILYAVMNPLTALDLGITGDYATYTVNVSANTPMDIPSVLSGNTKLSYYPYNSPAVYTNVMDEINRMSDHVAVRKDSVYESLAEDGTLWIYGKSRKVSYLNHDHPIFFLPSNALIFPLSEIRGVSGIYMMYDAPPEDVVSFEAYLREKGLPYTKDDIFHRGFSSLLSAVLGRKEGFVSLLVFLFSIGAVYAAFRLALHRQSYLIHTHFVFGAAPGKLFAFMTTELLRPLIFGTITGAAVYFVLCGALNWRPNLFIPLVSSAFTMMSVWVSFAAAFFRAKSVRRGREGK